MSEIRWFIDTLDPEPGPALWTVFEGCLQSGYLSGDAEFSKSEKTNLYAIYFFPTHGLPGISIKQPEALTKAISDPQFMTTCACSKA